MWCYSCNLFGLSSENIAEILGVCDEALGVDQVTSVTKSHVVLQL